MGPEDGTWDASHDGLVFCFTHAPLLSLHRDRTEGMETLFEDNHARAPRPPNDVTVWLAKHMSAGWVSPWTSCSDMDALEQDPACREELCRYFKGHGYPQGGTRHFKEGQRDNILNFSCADGKVQELFEFVAPGPTRSYPVSGSGPRKLAVLFSGHTHKVHEFRIEACENGSEDGFRIFLDDYSGDSLPRARNKASWLAGHAPLLITSGRLKGQGAQFREVVIAENAVQSMEMVHRDKTRVWLESGLYPDRFILSPRGGQAAALVTGPLHSHEEVEANSLRIVPGLAHSGQVSFECLAVPGSYLCKRGNLLVAQTRNGDASEEDATFRIVPALSGEPYPAVSIESYASPETFWQDGGPGDWMGHLMQVNAVRPSSSEQSRQAAVFQLHGPSMAAARGVDWERIGDGRLATAMACVEGKLFATTRDNKLWLRDAVAGEAGWSHIGHANAVVAMAACDGKLYAATSDNKLWQREPVPRDVSWRLIGHANRVVGMAAADGRLFATTSDNRLWVRPPVAEDVPWSHIGHAKHVTAMTALNGRLVVATRDGSLWMRYPIVRDVAWLAVADRREGVVALAGAGALLFAVTRDNRLWVNDTLWMTDLGPSRGSPWAEIQGPERVTVGSAEMASVTYTMSHANLVAPVRIEWSVEPGGRPTRISPNQAGRVVVLGRLLPGAYRVTLTVSDRFAATASATKRLVVEPR